MEQKQMNGFESYSKRRKWLIAVLLTVFGVGCGSSGGGGTSDANTGTAEIGGSGAGVATTSTTSSTTTTSPDYGVWNESSGCFTSNNPSYNNKLAQLAQSLFRLSAAPVDGNGCVTEPYLADGYSRYIPGMENHAGIDFRAPSGTSAYAIYGGTVVNETLDVPGGHSTLVIQSTVGAQTLLVFYLHCQSHNNAVGTRLTVNMLVGDGDLVCQTGDVGATAAHLHLEVKVQGMDNSSLSAVFGTHCNSTFTAFNNTIETGCNLEDIRARTVDPTIAIVAAGPSTVLAGLFEFQFRVPLPGGWSWTVTANAGDWTDPGHQGNSFYSLDFAPSGYGSQIPIYAMHGGKVIEAPAALSNNDNNGNGYFVRVDQDGDGNRATGLTTVYLHFSDPPLVSAGDVIGEGKLLGYMGATGNVIPAGELGKHLHITLRYNDNGQYPNQELERVKIEGLSIRDFVVATSYLSSR